jgi:hypothetical protein
VNQNWTERLAAWRCMLSKKDSRGAQDEYRQLASSERNASWRRFSEDPVTSAVLLLATAQTVASERGWKGNFSLPCSLTRCPGSLSAGNSHGFVGSEHMIRPRLIAIIMHRITGRDSGMSHAFSSPPLGLGI